MCWVGVSIVGQGFSVRGKSSVKERPTFVVHVGGHLHHAQAEVDGQVVEVVVGLQDEISTQLHTVPLFIHLIYQHCIEVLILRERKKDRKTEW